MIIVIIVFNIVNCLLVIKNYIHLMNMLQQNHYDIKKYILTLKTYYLYKKYQYSYYLALLINISNLFLDNIYLLLLQVVLLLISIVIKNKYVIKLSWTKKIIRHSILTSLLISLIFVFLYKYIIFINLFMSLIIIIVTILLSPIEKLIKVYYKNKAIKKYHNYKGLIKIAITGSFGKTSTKNILHSILSNKYITHKTPASYNTMMGLSLNINNSNFNICDISILEMGAFRIGEIKEMVKATSPNIRVITEIGMQHLSTFKTIDNIVKAKFEIICDMKENDVLVVNLDNKYIKSNFERLNNKLNIYTYGLNDGDYRLKNIEYIDYLMQFDIYEKDVFKIRIKTKLLSVHNALNILCVYTICEALKKYGVNISNQEFTTYIKKVEATEHRLKLSNFDNINIIDDSYSSNVIGFKNACDVVKKFKGKKVIITPGIVDGGIYDEKINNEVAYNLIDGFDDICLIENKSSIYLSRILEDNNVSYHKFNSFNDAYFWALKKYNGITDVVNILIENDLPDSFLER